MLFNSTEFLFAFLPLCLGIYFLLNHWRLTLVAKCWLAASSLLFYSWWNPIYLGLLTGSLVFNYLLSFILINQYWKKLRQLTLALGIGVNLGLLGYFKYADFFIANINLLFDHSLPLLRIMLPLAISFFTFQQVAYLVDAYQKEIEDRSLLDYVLFVTFFPQLIAGPIVHHKEIMPQFRGLRCMVWNPRNVILGVLVFSIGLLKKVAVADSLSVWVEAGFDLAKSLTFVEAWIASLSFTFQLYFDFSGYADMAIGAALMFNIVLPANFDSPYKASNIQAFWARWHMTLTRFLTRYLYIPLGGNRLGSGRTYMNMMLVFLASGLWHGAGWTFVFWGFLHGAASMVNKLFRELGMRMNGLLAWAITFLFINAAWVFFRARTWTDALKVLRGMVGLNGFMLPKESVEGLGVLSKFGGAFFIEHGEFRHALLLLGGCLAVCLFARNSMQVAQSFRLDGLRLGLLVLLVCASLIYMLYFNVRTEFLYFNF